MQIPNHIVQARQAKAKAKGDGKSGKKGTKTKGQGAGRGTWLWLPSSVLAQATNTGAVSMGCACGLSDEESSISLSLFSFAVLICFVLFMYHILYSGYRAWRKVTPNPERVPDKKASERYSEVCEYCSKPMKEFPFPSCSFCKASPSFHHGRCCPVKNMATGLKEVAPEAVFSCATTRHAFHLSPFLSAFAKCKATSNQTRSLQNLQEKASLNTQSVIIFSKCSMTQKSLKLVRVPCICFIVQGSMCKAMLQQTAKGELVACFFSAGL